MANKVNWFPGHMAKTLAQMSKEIKNVDMVIYVLDARAPLSCLNPKFDDLCENKPILYVINKADLADDSVSLYVKNMLAQKDNCDCILLNSTQSGTSKIIEPIMKKLCEKKIQKYEKKELNIPLRAMVIGVPNCGKSTLINNMCGIKKTKTGDKAGVTRGKQWVALKNGFEILDTPGTLWPNLEDQDVAKKLCLLGSIRDEIVDMNDLSLYLVSIVQKYYPTLLQQRYGIVLGEDSISTLDNIAQKKHFLVKGGDIDYDRTCAMIIDDFRKARFGKISLDQVRNV